MSEFTNNWFDKNILVWEKLFVPLMGQPLQVLEIGSFEGQSTCWLLDHVLTHPDSRIICVDPFESEAELQNEDFVKVKERFLKNTEKYGKKVDLHVEKSVNYLTRAIYAQHLFDVIYIDGSHFSSDALIDGVLSHLLLRSGGLLIFDDYLLTNLYKHFTVPRGAIDAFMECFANEYDLVTSGYQVILKKK